MQHAIPVVDLDDVDLAAVRAGTEELGVIQVVNHLGPAHGAGPGVGSRQKPGGGLPGGLMAARSR
jgi:hypothetical protein